MRKLTFLLAIASIGILSSCSSNKVAKNDKNNDASKSKDATASAAPATKSVATAQSEKTNENELKWYGWNEGYALSQSSKKIVLVDLYTSWCGWCKRMDHDTYTNPEVIKYINSKFIPIKLNPEAEGTYTVDKMSMSGMQLMGMLTNNQSTGYPTIVFIYPNRNIELYPGYQDAPGFKSTLTKVADSPNNKK